MGALYIQETLSYFYTSYGFANTFQTPDPGSVEVYQKATIPEVWLGEEVTDEVHIANKSSSSRYLRVAYVEAEKTQNHNSWSTFLTFVIGSVWNITDGIRGERDQSSGLYSVNENKWIENGPWSYYKTPLAAQTDIQIYDSFKFPADPMQDTGNYYEYDVDFIVETLPTTVSDEEFQNAWGVSKSELGLS